MTGLTEASIRSVLHVPDYSREAMEILSPLAKAVGL